MRNACQLRVTARIATLDDGFAITIIGASPYHLGLASTLSPHPTQKGNRQGTYSKLARWVSKQGNANRLVSRHPASAMSLEGRNIDIGENCRRSLPFAGCISCSAVWRHPQGIDSCYLVTRHREAGFEKSQRSLWQPPLAAQSYVVFTTKYPSLHSIYGHIRAGT